MSSKRSILSAFFAAQTSLGCFLRELPARGATHLARPAASRAATAFPKYFAQRANQYRPLILTTQISVVLEVFFITCSAIRTGINY